MEISKDAQKLLSGVDQATRDYATANAPGGKLTSGETSRLISAFKASNPYSAPNVASAMTNPAQSPDYNDIYGMRNRINDELGLSTVQKEYQDAIGGLRLYDTGTQGQQTNLEGQTVPLGVIRGEQDTALRQRSLERQSLADKAAILQDRFQAVQNEANTRFNLANQERERTLNLIYNNPAAGITLTDRPDVIASKIEGARMREEQRVMKISKEAEGAAYKKQLKAALIEVGQKTKGSTKELEKRLGKYNAEALAEAKALARQKAGGGTGGGNAYSDIDAAFKKNNGNWDATAADLAGKYDVGPGSVVDNELRRRNGLAPIVTQTATDIKLEAAEKLAEAKSSVEKEAVKTAMEKKLSLLKDVTGRGVGAGLFGAIERRIPSVTGSKADNLNTIKAIIGTETLNSLLNLKAQGGTLGAVSEKELSILQASASRVGSAQLMDKNGNVTGYKMTEKQFNAEIQSMKDATERVLKSLGLESEGEIVEKNGIKYRKVNGGWEQI